MIHVAIRQISVGVNNWNGGGMRAAVEELATDVEVV